MVRAAERHPLRSARRGRGFTTARSLRLFEGLDHDGQICALALYAGGELFERDLELLLASPVPAALRRPDGHLVRWRFTEGEAKVRLTIEGGALATRLRQRDWPTGPAPRVQVAVPPVWVPQPDGTVVALGGPQRKLTVPITRVQADALLALDDQLPEPGVARTLRAFGLVEPGDAGWRLTDAGHEALRRLPVS